MKSVTIAIPAHNEEKNIGSLLNSLISQSAENYNLDSIQVLCDGCTDNTATIASEYSKRNPKIKVIYDEEHLGKINRLNKLFTQTDSDIIVVLDADIKINDNTLIEKLISPFFASSKVGLVGGAIVPNSPIMFRKKIFFAWNEIWNKTLMNNNESVHRVYGAIFTLDKTLYKNLVIPKEIIAEDEFLYFENKKRGFQFAFAKEAVAYFQLPKTFREYFRQSARHITTKNKMFVYFGQEIEKDYRIPLSVKVRAIFSVLMKSPILAVLAIFLQIFVRLYCRFYSGEYKNNVWEQVTSTK